MSVRSKRAYEWCLAAKYVSCETCGHNELCPYKGSILFVLIFYYYWIARTSKLWMNRENQRYSRLSGPMLKSRSSMLRFGRKPCFASYTW